MRNNKAHIKNSYLLSALSIGFVLLIWEMISRYELINSLLFPPPSDVVSAFLDWYQDSFWLDFLSSIKRAVIGLLFGALIGVILGILTGRLFLIDRLVSPLLNVLRSFPPVAIIPFIILWLGIGETAKIFSIFFASIMPIWISTHNGVKNVPVVYLKNAKIQNISTLRVYFQIILPASLSSIVSGVRIAIAIAFIMIYVSELTGSSRGIGYQIDINHLAYRIDRMMAALFVLGLMATMLDWLFNKSIYALCPWLKFIKY